MLYIVQRPKTAEELIDRHHIQERALIGAMESRSNASSRLGRLVGDAVIVYRELKVEDTLLRLLSLGPATSAHIPPAESIVTLTPVVADVSGGTRP